MMDATVVKELRTIQGTHGLLRAEDVVQAARVTTSPLHDYFTWDDGEAAHLYRLTEARQLIRSAVEYRQIEAKTVQVQVFCSLTPDRKEMGGGYRSLVDVLENRTLRDQRLADLVAELQRLQSRCSEFQELRRVYEAIEQVMTKFPPKGVRRPRKAELADV